MLKEGNRQVDDKKPQATLYNAGNSDVERTVFIGRKHATNHVSQFGALTVCKAESSQITEDNGNKAQHDTEIGHEVMDVLQKSST